MRAFLIVINPQIIILIIYYINVQSPNLDLKQGISYLGRERGERDTEIDTEIDR
jgi:hypothetical protein